MIAEMVAISSGETMSFHTARGWLNDWVANKAGPNQERIEWECEWSAKPKPRVIAEYRRWILSVWQFVADETGLKLMELLQVKPRLWEAWSFEPGRAPVKVEEVSA
jgi:hypothetical protein